MTTTAQSSLSQEEIEYLTLLRNRFKFLAIVIFNSPFNDFESEKRFSILKDLYSVYSELYSMEFFEEITPNNSPLLEQQTKFHKDLIKMIRNVLQHLPFFNSWDEVYLQKSLILLNVKTNKQGVPISAIDKFFKNPVYAAGGAVRYKEFTGDETTFIITIPKGYDNNDKIYLKEIIPEKYVGKFSVGFIAILLNNFLKSRGLFDLVIPNRESME